MHAGRLALVYRGPASLPGCPEAVARVIRASTWDLEVCFVGPRERMPLSADVLSQAALYAQPGGGDLRPAYRRLRRQGPAIREFVRSGGHYLGFCLGGYLAGETPGFGLLPGDADRYISSPGACTTTARESVIDVAWGEGVRSVYFEDGPYFALDPRRGPAEVLATYRNGLPAAVVAPCGDGAVGVCGPHPEATPDWYPDPSLVPARSNLDLATGLLDRTMRA